MAAAEKGIVVRLPGQRRAKLEAVASSRGRSLNFVLNEAVERYVVEEAWLVDEIRGAVEDADSPDAVFVPQAEVMAGLEAAIAQARRRHVS